jgi:excinuclease ABC subunit B
MAAPRKTAAGPKSKASPPEVHPLGEHLAELLNPALAERRGGFGEAPQPKFESPAPESHPRGLTGAAVSADSLKALLEEGDPPTTWFAIWIRRWWGKACRSGCTGSYARRA